MNQLSSKPEIPNIFILSRRIELLIESNALQMSRKTTPVSSPLSMSLNQLSHIWINAEVVEWSGRKPNWNSGGKDFSFR